MLNFLTALLEPFRFIKHRRERQKQQWMLEDLARKDAAAHEAFQRQEERSHQLKLAQTFMAGLTAMQEAQRDQQQASVDGLTEVAKAIAKQAESFGSWIALFQTSGPGTTSVVRDEDEILRDQMKLLDAGMPAELADLPEELRLAWVLKNDPTFMDIGDLKP